MIETHRRRELLAQHAPTADTQWAEAIIAADPLWGPDQRLEAPHRPDHHTGADPCASLLKTRAVPTGRVRRAAEPSTGSTPIGDDEAELAALEADLQNLYRP